MEKYFRLVGGRPFVNPDYIHREEEEKREISRVNKTWQEFFGNLGLSRCPRVKSIPYKWSYWFEIKEKAEYLGFTQPEYTPGYANSLVDYDVDGLEDALNYAAGEASKFEETNAVWETMSYLFKNANTWERTAILRWKRYGDRSDAKTASWARHLKEKSG